MIERRVAVWVRKRWLSSKQPFVNGSLSGNFLAPAPIDLLQRTRGQSVIPFGQPSDRAALAANVKFRVRYHCVKLSLITA